MVRLLTIQKVTLAVQIPLPIPQQRITVPKAFTVNMEVIPVSNDAPVITVQNVFTDEDTSVALNLVKPAIKDNTDNDVTGVNHALGDNPGRLGVITRTLKKVMVRI